MMQLQIEHLFPQLGYFCALKRFPVHVDKLLQVLQFLYFYLFLTLVYGFELTDEVVEGHLLLFVLILYLDDDAFDYAITPLLCLIDETYEFIFSCLYFLVKRLNEHDAVIDGGSCSLSHSIIIHN